MGWQRICGIVGLSVLLLGTSALGLPGSTRAEFTAPGLEVAAERYASTIQLKAPKPGQAKTGGKSGAVQREEVLTKALSALQRGDGANAVAGFEQALMLGAPAAQTLLDLSSAWMIGPKPDRQKALEAAFIAYRATPAENELARVSALVRLADLFRHSFDNPDLALKALDEVRQMAERHGEQVLEAQTPGWRTAYDEVRALAGISLRNVRVDEAALPARACLEFSDTLSDKAGLRWSDYVAVEPAGPVDFEGRGSSLCINGLNHGSTYHVTLRQGLPGQGGLALRREETRAIRVPDRPAMAAFKGSAFILPRGGADGIPVVSVNSEELRLRILRLPERAIVPELRNHQLFTALNEWSDQQLSSEAGRLVWEGTMSVTGADGKGMAGKRNQDVVTALPIRQALGPDPAPGLYAMTVVPNDTPQPDGWMERATQWLIVTDIGLTSFMGTDGLTVFARSYGTAKPMAGVELSLIARDNDELTKAVTDADGRAIFPQGSWPQNAPPRAVMAREGQNDFAMLDLGTPAFDLSDRGVAGRAAPGPMDGFVFAERGVYRQGETVNLTFLLRDNASRAVADLPLTVKVLRPSGTEYLSTVLKPGPAGGYSLSLPLSDTAPLGGWQVQALSDPSAEPVGRTSFQVDDFVPQKLELSATPSAQHIRPGEEFSVAVTGRFLYGPPAAGLKGDADLVLMADPEPFPDFKDYRFGLFEDRVEPQLHDLEFPLTDAAGQASLPVTLPTLPDTTRPLRAVLRVALAEPGGRPVRTTLRLPVRNHDVLIGLRPQFADDTVATGADPQFEVVALDSDGRPQARPGLRWTLLEEKTTYQWYLSEGQQRYRPVTRDVSVGSGKLDAKADGPVRLAVGKRDWGRFRVELVDEASGAATSYRFSSGWQTTDDTGDAPDKLLISANQPVHKPGDNAKLRITAPFAGELLVTVASNRILEHRILSIPADGTDISIPVSADWGPGAYVTATAYRPPVKGRERQPVRAIGVAWLGVDPAGQTLDVVAVAPALARPRGPLTVDLQVVASDTGDPVEDTAMVTVAAVDEGILRLTDYTSPQPEGHFLGKRRLGLDIRDDYGRLIDALDGPAGALRQGGDASGAALPAVPFKIVSLFSGPVEVNRDGTARISFDVPEFNGELRVMAVAWSGRRVGSASLSVTVRDPLVADVSTPRFLAPGDDSRLSLSLHNVEGQAGDYQVTVEGRDAVTVEGGQMTVPLAAGERKLLTLPLRGNEAGIGQLHVAVRGPDEAVVTQDRAITVRPPQPAETRFVLRELGPKATVRLDASDLAGMNLASFVPGTVDWSISFSRNPPLDVAGLLRSLDRYPLGCVEQTISRALPLLVVQDVEKAIKPTGAEANAPDWSTARVQRAISSVLDRQRYDGGFGLWSANEPTDEWLSAYVTEFLLRARARGHAVPDKPLADALGWVRGRVLANGLSPEDLAVRAYGLHVLALGGVSLPGPARYLHDTALDGFPTALSRGHLASALARMGDRERAGSAFDAAVATLTRDPWAVDYGSTVRDAAALVVLVSETGMTAGRLSALVDRLPMSATATDSLNTQEQAWAVLAADALLRGETTSVTITVPTGQAQSTGKMSWTASGDNLAGGVSFVNAGRAPVWQALSLTGVPASPTTAAREGLRVRRNFLTRRGEPVDLEQVRQNDQFIVLLEGEAQTGISHLVALTQALPAGWEIESVIPQGGEGTELEWLGQLTTPRTAEARDDRYVAAFDLEGRDAKFRLAFLVRAVTPGDYAMPGAVVEDMYKPRFYARQTVNRIKVAPRD